MKTTKNNEHDNLQGKLLAEIKNDLREKRFIHPRYYEENMNYFRRQAELMD